MFSLCFRWARVLDSSSLDSAELLPIFEKAQLISGDKKTFRKKPQFISGMFFFSLFFFVALITFFLNRSKVVLLGRPH